MGQTSTRLAAVLIAAGVFAAGCGDDKTTDAGGATTTAKTGAPLTVCSDIPYEPMEFEDAKARKLERDARLAEKRAAKSELAVAAS